MFPRNDKLIGEIRSRLQSSDWFARLHARLGQSKIELTGMSLEARALLLATLQQHLRRPLAIILPGDASVSEFEAAVKLFHPDPARVATYPNPSLSPYQEVAHSLAVRREEILSLGQLAHRQVELLIIPARALFQRVPSPEQFLARTISLAAGMEIDVRSFLERLLENGFTRTDLVGEPADFAFRGGILDLFPPNSPLPIRIELFGDTIESIRHFEVESQRSLDSVDRAVLYPATQFPRTRELRSAIARRLALDFQERIFKRDLNEKVDRLTEQTDFPGIESFIPVATETSSLLQALDDSWQVVRIEPEEMSASLEKFESHLRAEYEAAVAKGKAVYPPEQILVPSRQIDAWLGKATLAVSALHVSGRGFEEVRAHAPEAARYFNRLSELPSALAGGREQGRQQVLFTSTKGGREKVERLLTEFSIPFADNAVRLGPDMVVSPGTLPRGFDFEQINLSVFSEWDLFEPPTSTRVGGRRRTSEAFLTDLRDLRAGDYIVHLDHGVGRFVGLQRIAFGETEREVMQLEYANSGKLLLPMESLHLIQKYSAGEEAQPRLDRLGGTSWARTKASIKKAMRDMADELLKLYATRRMISGHAFSKDAPWQFEFEESFEFDETEDQIAAIEEVKGDMESRRPMDRLLCGDVGYGKTEVAMRAAFKAVLDGKQVAMLAPTTILAFQHYRTFLRRFASFPVSIELLTRYRSAREQKQIARKIADGEIDILIGTHRILSKDARFKDLGLLIIDEEQRFGVGQKETLKQMKKSVDVLSMSATPIPRTLHMSLVGIRDISIIETPPKDRLAIQTAVVPFDDTFIREAIEFEVGRGGQVFVVHNRVESIHAMQEYLQRLIPGIRVIVGHGQIEERELERRMMAFIERQYDVLLSTTIIENGIDIPACNTMVINHAERFGLSQLYQLRGRVGRSDRLAFCYLLVPRDRTLSSDARKRLAAIQEFADLGAGFRIAARDLEIRGSGNILGGEQSGHIAAVGFEMYVKLLEEAVAELKGEKVEEEIEPAINLGVDIYIPRDYIGDENLRMTFYKKIASARDEPRLDEIRNELRDRFGAVPDNVEGLLEFIRLKLFARQIGVVSIARQGSIAAIKFHPGAKINPNKLLELLGTNPAAKFTPAGVLSFPLRQQGRAIIRELEQLLASTALAA